MKLHEKSRILLVEDNPATRITIRGMLESLGYINISEAENGREALHVIDASAIPFELIISDLKMPGVSGVELLRDFRMLFPKIPFIIVSAYHDIESVKLAKESGVTCFLAKPFNKEALKERLDYVSDRMLSTTNVCTSVDTLINQLLSKV